MSYPEHHPQKQTDLFSTGSSVPGKHHQTLPLDMERNLAAYSGMVRGLVTNVSIAVQVPDAAVVGGQPADLGRLHDLLAVDLHRVLKIVLVPALEQGHEDSDMAGQDAVIFTDGFIKPCQLPYLHPAWLGATLQQLFNVVQPVIMHATSLVDFCFPATRSRCTVLEDTFGSLRTSLFFSQSFAGFGCPSPIKARMSLSSCNRKACRSSLVTPSTAICRVIYRLPNQWISLDCPAWFAVGFPPSRFSPSAPRRPAAVVPARALCPGLCRYRTEDLLFAVA